MMLATAAARSARIRRPVSVIPQRGGPSSDAILLDEELLTRVSLSDHALERFAERAGLNHRAR